MNKKIFLFLILFLISLNFVLGAEKVVKTYINFTITPNVNTTTFNFTLFNEDELIKINNLDSNSTYQSENYLITFIRDLSCESIDTINLTIQCLEKVATVDGTALKECYESKGRQFETIQSCQSENSELRGQSGNLTICQSSLNERTTSLSQCSNQKGELDQKIKDSANEKWYFALFAGIIAGLGYWRFGNRLYKLKGLTSRVQSEYAINPTKEPEIPPEFKKAMETGEGLNFPPMEKK